MGVSNGDGDDGGDGGEGSEERSPLASLLHGFSGALPHGDVIHGGGKTWLQTPPELGFKMAAASGLFCGFLLGV